MSENSVVLKLHGKIDSGNSETVKEKLLSELAQHEAEKVVLDAGALTDISGSGLRMLLQIRKVHPDLSMIDVKPEVYEILEMTGLTEMMDVEKALRFVSVEGCEVIGEGANGKVYRIDRETIVKIYKDADALPEIQNERRVARLALILGIPTAISYDVVRAGDCYGSVFELLDAQSFSKILAEHPEKTDWCVREYVDMLKRIHSTRVPEGKLPPVKQTAQEWVSRMKSCLTQEQGQKLQDMIDAVPDRPTMIHGDYHTKNIVLSNGEVFLIDMDTLSTGHPIFELAQMFCSLVGFYELFPQSIIRFQGFDAEMGRTFWRRSLKAYLETEEEQTVTEMENKIRCVAYARLIDWSMRHHGTDDPASCAEREFWRQELIRLLDCTDTLLTDEDRKLPETVNGGTRPEDEALPGKMLLNSRQVLKTDLHMHTTVSDGTDTPAEVLEKVRNAGIPLFSVTDHDSVKGCRIVRDSLQEGDPLFITGVELSCRNEAGQYHILGYGFDPDAPSIQKLMEIGHAYRIRKVRARLDYLKKAFNISLPDEAVGRLYSMDNPGKPHIGNLMVKYGFAPTRDLAIRKFLNQIHFYNEYLNPEEAIIGILAAGGIPVLAHPVFGSGKEQISGKALEQRVKNLMSFGLRGVEAFYSGFSVKQRSEVIALAEKYDLYVTAGSDYHGKNKEIRPGETGLDSVPGLPDGFRRFLEDVSTLQKK